LGPKGLPDFAGTTLSFFLYAHRGASAHAPENTLAAFHAALETEADGVELDVHLSADGVPVVIHDATLERTTDGLGAVGNWPAAGLATLDAGSWFAPEFAGESVPTLGEVLALLSGRLRVNIEVKDVAAALATLEVLREFPAVDVILSSFDHMTLQVLRRADAQVPLAVLSDELGWRRLIPRALELYASAVHRRADLISRPLLMASRAAGLPVLAWTVDDPGQARSLLRAGVAGLFTNDPAGLRMACGRGPVYSS